MTQNFFTSVRIARIYFLIIMKTTLRYAQDVKVMLPG